MSAAAETLLSEWIIHSPVLAPAQLNDVHVTPSSVYSVVEIVRIVPTCHYCASSSSSRLRDHASCGTFHPHASGCWIDVFEKMPTGANATVLVLAGALDPAVPLIRAVTMRAIDIQSRISA